MFFEVMLDDIPAGFALSSGEKGQTVEVEPRRFLTTDDGETLYIYLDGISSQFLNKNLTGRGMKISQIDQCLVVITKNKVAKVYINDFPTALEIVSKGNVQKGQPITKEDIADIQKVIFPTIEIEQDNGIIYIFSYGWRKALYFDYTPLRPGSKSTLGDIGSLFAKFYTIMLFKELFHLNDSILNEMYDEGWFPFVRILGRKFENLYKDFENRFSSKSGEKTIVEHFGKDTLKEMLASWKGKDLFQPHIPFLERGMERYLAGDYISSISILFPRIEGILRYVYLGEKGKPTQTSLVSNLWKKVSEKCLDTSLFLPDRFREYLKRFYFANFNLETGELDLSRHTIGHGVARQQDFQRVKALQGILILDQLFYYL